MAAAAPIAAAGLGGLFQAIGGAKPKSSTSTFNQSGTQEAVLGGKQQKVNKALFQKILEAIQQGPTVSQADRNTMRNQVNQGYNSANTNLEANLAGRGFANSGKYGAGVRLNSLEKAKTTQAGEATLTDQAQNRFMQMIQAAFQFDQPRVFNSSSQGTQTSTGSGTPWQTSLGGGLGDISSLLWLRNMGGGAGGGGGGGSNPFATNPSICWISQEIFGETDIRTLLVRAYLLTQARRSLKWAAAVAFYRLTGRHVARLIRWNRTARRACEAMFKRLAVEAINS